MPTCFSPREQLLKVLASASDSCALDRRIACVVRFSQSSTGAVGQALRIAEVIKVANPRSLRAFVKSRSFSIKPLQAFGQQQRADTLLFHGCPQVAATNIQAEGLTLAFAGTGMLGRGLYGAPDPRKSVQFCGNSPNGRFMFICRFNLSSARHAGPSTQHPNSVFDEFCIYDETHVVVLWMIKLAP